MKNDKTILCGMFMRFFPSSANGHTPESTCTVCGNKIGWGRAYELHESGIRHVSCQTRGGDQQTQTATLVAEGR